MPSENTAPEFWEANFIQKQEMWGFEPAPSAVVVKDLFVDKGIKNLLIPGVGYGRNARIFKENGIKVTGIEISQTAIELARKHIGSEITIYHGPVTEMPFDQIQYDGIFCYALIHLLNADERLKLIQDCYHQLAPYGYMAFVAISKEAPTYGQGPYLSPDRYEVFPGVQMFFYDPDSIQAEFGPFGLMQVTQIQENYPFYLILCKKDASV